MFAYRLIGSVGHGPFPLGDGLAKALRKYLATKESEGLIALCRTVNSEREQ
jgi:hypothetical protein